MAVDRKHLGRRYGPFRFEVSVEQIRDFVAATGGGVPGHAFSSPPDRHHHPWTWDEEAAKASPHGGIVAPPGVRDDLRDRAVRARVRRIPSSP